MDRRNRTSRTRRPVRAVFALLALALVGAVLAVTPANADPAAADGRQTYTGTIDGADYRVEMPEQWNGTLIVYSHGYYPPVFQPDYVEVANRREVEQYWLDRGYALAGSRFRDNGVGYIVKEGPEDQLALLDWFEENLGSPTTTITSGFSQGATISLLLAERSPERFDGVVTMCGEVDTHSTWNSALDINFVVKTLLAPDADIDLVKPRDAAASTEVLTNAIEVARETPEGRARLALAGAVANIPGWYVAHEPEPTELADRIIAQSLWSQWAYTFGIGPNGRVDLEARAGGNPSWNVGVDYGRLLARSSQHDLVVAAYTAAPEVELRADLEQLARAPRIKPDPDAVAYQHRYGVAGGTTPAPVITLHTTGDGGAVADQERWYAGQVRRHGDPAKLRQVYIDRGGHCSFSAAEEIVTLQTLLDRVESGRWPSLNPSRLDAAVEQFGPEYQNVLDFGTGVDAPVTPAYVRYTPSKPLRPSR